MSERDFAMALAMLAEAFGERGLTPVRIEAYQRALSDVPMPLLNAAVRRAIETRQWFPKVSELRSDAEACRTQLIAEHPYQPCSQCDETGWARLTIDGKPWVKRCVCWVIHQQKMQQLGATAQALALPPVPEYVND